jgi:hypothetical protein
MFESPSSEFCMTREKAAALSVGATVLSVLVALSQAFALFGHTARAVDVVGLFAGGVGVGAGVAATVISLRMLKRHRTDGLSRISAEAAERAVAASDDAHLPESKPNRLRDPV